MSILDFDVENGYDFLNIYDGKSLSDNLISTLSGNHHDIEFTSTGSFLRLVFTSDNSVTARGFKISWTTIELPEEVTTPTTTDSPPIFPSNSDSNLNLALQVKTCAGFECRFTCSGEELKKKLGISKVLYELVRLSCEDNGDDSLIINTTDGSTSDFNGNVGFMINGHFEEHACSGALFCTLDCDGSVDPDDDGILRKLDRLLSSFNSFFDCE